MAETKFTPGPWFADGPFVGSTEGRHDIVSAVYSKPVEEADANAHLIAAAPELYEALEKALPLLRAARKQAWDGALEAEAEANHALAVARGEQP